MEYLKDNQKILIDKIFIPKTLQQFTERHMLVVCVPPVTSEQIAKLL